jgi:hypothetical protein
LARKKKIHEKGDEARRELKISRSHPLTHHLRVGRELSRSSNFFGLGSAGMSNDDRYARRLCKQLIQSHVKHHQPAGQFFPTKAQRVAQKKFVIAESRARRESFPSWSRCTSRWLLIVRRANEMKYSNYIHYLMNLSIVDQIFARRRDAMINQLNCLLILFAHFSWSRISTRIAATFARGENSKALPIDEMR